MKYKVTITSTDLTGHEETKVIENIEESTPISLLGIGKSILIEPMPEKKKVTVWFYVVTYQNGGVHSKSHICLQTLNGYRNADVLVKLKVSEIQSMEVEI